MTYAQLIGKIRQTANMLNDLGVGPTDVVTYLLPNFPQTHFILWGAEAADIANPINPLLEAATIADICRTAKTKMLVALGEMPGIDIWQKVASIRNDIPSLKYVIRLMGPSDEANGILGYEEKVARRSHHNELVLAWDLKFGIALQTGESVMCGLLLFHCNGTCVTGLMPFIYRGHVVLLSLPGIAIPRS